MLYKELIGIVATSLLLAAASPALAQGQGQGQGQGTGDRDTTRQMDRDQTIDHDRMMDRDRDQMRDKDGDQDRDRDRDRIHQDATIYGSALMTEEERMQYRKRLETANTEQEKARIRAEHHKAMQERAREKGVKLPDPTSE